MLMTLGERRINMCALKNWQLKFQGGVGREIMAEVLRPLARQIAWKTENIWRCTGIFRETNRTYKEHSALLEASRLKNT